MKDLIFHTDKFRVKCQIYFGLFLFLLILPPALHAQNPADTIRLRPENDFYANLLGDASLISLNYERLIVNQPRYFIVGKLGLGYNEEFQLCIFGPCSPPNQYLTFTQHITANFGSRRSYAEVGLGGTLLSGNSTSRYLLYPLAGYRFQPLKSGKVNFRVTLSYPFWGLKESDILYVPFGFGVGLTF